VDKDRVLQVDPGLSKEARTRGFRLMLISSMFAVVGSQVFAGNILIMLAWNLGARERYIGFLQFLIFGSALAQLLIVRLSQRRSKKSLAMLMITLAYAFTVPVFFSKWVSQNVGLVAGLTLLAVCVGGRQTCVYLSFPSWMGLLREMTSPRRRGRLLGQLRTGWQSVMAVTLVLAGLYLGKEPPWDKLALVIIIGLSAQVLRLVAFLPVPSTPTRPPDRNISWWQMVVTPMRDTAYRPFLIYLLTYGLALGVSERFRIVYLLRLGFGQHLALIAASLINLGAVMTLMFWGRLADRFGNRGVFGLTLSAMIACSLLWLLVGPSKAGFALAMLLFLATGSFNSGHGLVQTRYMFGSLKPQFDAAYIAATTLALLASSGVGSLLGGQILAVFDGLGLNVSAGGLNNYHVIFMLSAVMFLLSAGFRRKFREPTEPPTKEVLTAITQPMRTVAGALLFWPKNNGDADNARNEE